MASSAVAQSLEQLENQYLEHTDNGDFREAAKVAQRGLELARRVAPNDPDTMATVYYYLGSAQYSIGKYAAAEKNLSQSIAIDRRAYGDDPDAADLMLMLAQIYLELGRYDDAENEIDRARRIYERHLGPRSLGTADCLLVKGYHYMLLGRFAEAEPMLTRALQLAEELEGKGSINTCDFLDGLSELYGFLGRHDESADYNRRSYAIRRRELPDGHLFLVGNAWNEGWILGKQGDHEKAIKFLDYSKQLIDRKMGRANRDAAEVRYNLAEVYFDMGKYDEAEKLLQEALEIVVQYTGGKTYPLAAWGHNALARVHLAANKLKQADTDLQKAILLGPLGVSGHQRYLSHLYRAELLWRRGERNVAVAELRLAMQFAEEQRGRSAGAEHQRAQYFSVLTEAFEKMVAWQNELGDYDAALNAMERSRARSLIDQMTVQGIDLLAGVAPEEADRLRRAERRARERVARLEGRLKELGLDDELSDQERRRRSDSLFVELRDARKTYVQTYAAIRNASPAYQLAIGQDQKPIALDTLQEWVDRHNGLLLEYLIGTAGSHALTVPAGGEASLVPIELTEQQAEVLQTTAGPLTLSALTKVLTNSDKTGVMDLLKKANRPKMAAAADRKLAALWEVLVPRPARDRLAGDHENANTVGRLMIIPDGPLAMLPFEALVVDREEDETKYLLDVGPPVHYAPSATVLLNVANREAVGQTSPKPVLSVGDPTYLSETKGRRSTTAATRFAKAGGPHLRLPLTAWESAWIEQVFGKAGIGVERLMRAEANEANVRRLLPNRRIVHLACHGVADQAHGNLFGALALAPGRSASAEPTDDGYLTLAEIYSLQMRGCELAILSACDTNYGPQQKGEGVWALSRGFLVAGSRRVVASNWLVDDEAAASLVSYFCSGVAKREDGEDSTDYAKALHNAKRWTRSQDKWQSPYCWGTFVLVGPQ